VAHLALDPGIIPNFFSPEEAEAMRRSVQAFKAEGMLHDQSTGPADGVQNYQMHYLSEVSWLWRALPWEDRVMEAVTALLDCPNIEVHLDQMFLKPPKVGRGTLHHQDNGTPSADSSLCAAISMQNWLTVGRSECRLLPDRGPTEGHRYVDRRRPCDRGEWHDVDHSALAPRPNARAPA
jgi:hypothetical protein